MTSDEDKLQAAVKRHLGDRTRWAEWPGGWPGEIEVCLVDAIYSANATYGKPRSGVRDPTGVHRVIERLRDLRGSKRLDSLQALVAVLASGELPVLGNAQHSPGTSQLKEDSVRYMAEAYVSGGVNHSADLDRYLRSAGQEARWPRHEVRGRIKGVGPQTWEYFLMLAGHSGVKADRMICSFVARALGADSIQPERAGQLVKAAADQLEVEPRQLDHAIWDLERSSRSRRSR